MLKAFSDFFDRAFGDSAGGADRASARAHALRVATALLLVEVARADYSEDLTEDRTVLELIEEFFELDRHEASMLIAEARREADHAASLQTFTRRLHEQLTVAEKHLVVEMLWKVALADRRLDKHEDHLVRKVAELLYVPHRDLIRIRNRIHQPGA
jgi:uncharacterized tellurite resistance protein B-like protein